MGQNGGQFFGLHMIAVDSKGNIYTGEVFNGERVQRFRPRSVELVETFGELDVRAPWSGDERDRGK